MNDSNGICLCLFTAKAKRRSKGKESPSGGNTARVLTSGYLSFVAAGNQGIAFARFCAAGAVDRFVDRFIDCSIDCSIDRFVERFARLHCACALLSKPDYH